jgi:transcriptional regulator with XRE-family HTH domain
MSQQRAILASNLRRMIDAEELSVRAWALKRELDVKMIDRLTKGEHAVTLDKLEEIAQAVGLKPWMLLIEDLDPENPPDAPISDEDRKMLLRLRRLLDN